MCSKILTMKSTNSYWDKVEKVKKELKNSLRKMHHKQIKCLYSILLLEGKPALVGLPLHQFI